LHYLYNMKEKIKTTDIYNSCLDLGDGYRIAIDMLRMRDSLQHLFDFCSGEVKEQGEFAKVYANHMSERFESLTREAEQAVSDLLSRAKENTK